ncbi:hypothetical protein Hdeb2414_s0004g00134021 [Helianthus debilis subsp. tardiflorus]
MGLEKLSWAKAYWVVKSRSDAEWAYGKCDLLLYKRGIVFIQNGSTYRQLLSLKSNPRFQRFQV